jgi:hypothetical protein
VLDSVLTISTKCCSIGMMLRQAACAKQSSQPGLRMTAPGLAMLQELFKACLEVFVPVQRHLAAPYSSIEGLDATRGKAAFTDITWFDNDPDSGVTKLYSGQASNLGAPLFRLLTGSMAAFDQQHGERWAAVTALSCCVPCSAEQNSHMLFIHTLQLRGNWSCCNTAHRNLQVCRQQ